MSGHIRKRGANSFELKYDAGLDPRTGKRRTKYVSFKGTKREAQVKLAELVAAVGAGTHIDASKITIAEFVRSRINQWESSGKISTRTAERYHEFCNYQIAPFVGAIALQKLTSTLSNGIQPCSPRDASGASGKVASPRAQSATPTGCYQRRWMMLLAAWSAATSSRKRKRGHPRCRTSRRSLCGTLLPSSRK
jgi:hypothetical protein